MAYYYALYRVGPLDEYGRFILRSERRLSRDKLEGLVLKYLPEGLERVEQQVARGYGQPGGRQRQVSLEEYLSLAMSAVDLEDVLAHVLDVIEEREPGMERVRVSSGLSYHRGDDLVLKGSRDPLEGPLVDGWVARAEQVAQEWARTRSWSAVWEAKAAKGA